MRTRGFHLIAAVLLGVALAGGAGAPASADGWRHRHFGHGHFHRGHHGHSSFVLGLNLLWPFYRYPPDYDYAPPPRVVYVERPPVCRRFDGDATVDANGRRFFGTACLWPDGRWHIVN